jgi:hypothetical protein
VTDYAKMFAEMEQQLREDTQHLTGEQVLAQVDRQYRLYQQALDNTVDIGTYTIDEMAIAFTDDVEMLRFVSVMNRVATVDHFNGGLDTVEAMPLHSAYRVQYEWLRTAFPWRIEAMTIRDGFSGVHAHRAWLAREPEALAKNLGWVHASYKVPGGLAGYYDACVELNERGWACAQQCTSDYGKFSYWVPVGERLAQLTEADAVAMYLKPRINLRDESTS